MASCESALSCVSLDLYYCHSHLMDGFPKLEKKTKKKSYQWDSGSSSLSASVLVGASKASLDLPLCSVLVTSQLWHFYVWPQPIRVGGSSCNLYEGHEDISIMCLQPVKGGCSVSFDLYRSLSCYCFYG